MALLPCYGHQVLTEQELKKLKLGGMLQQSFENSPEIAGNYLLKFKCYLCIIKDFLLNLTFTKK